MVRDHQKSVGLILSGAGRWVQNNPSDRYISMDHSGGLTWPNVLDEFFVTSRSIELVCSCPFKWLTPLWPHIAPFPCLDWFYCTKRPIHFQIKGFCIPSVLKLVISLSKSSQPLGLAGGWYVTQVVMPSMEPRSRDGWHFAMTHMHSCNLLLPGFCHSEPHGGVSWK